MERRYGDLRSNNLKVSEMECASRSCEMVRVDNNEEVLSPSHDTDRKLGQVIFLFTGFRCTHESCDVLNFILLLRLILALVACCAPLVL